MQDMTLAALTLRALRVGDEAEPISGHLELSVDGSDFIGVAAR
jgi:hypothetical protein